MSTTSTQQLDPHNVTRNTTRKATHSEYGEAMVLVSGHAHGIACVHLITSRGRHIH
jgi:hypothetical protein